jgi:hypothetical protein
MRRGEIDNWETVQEIDPKQIHPPYSPAHPRNKQNINT